jgi:mono/diheme cytochrome c family protein
MRPLVLTLLGLLLFVACGGSDDTESVTATSTSAPSTTSVVTTTSEPATTTSVVTTTSAVTTTPEPATTTTTISAEQLATAEAVGDVAAGEVLFNEPLDGLPHSASCTTCHTLDGIDGRNPTMVGISAVAASRIGGMSAVDYLRQSILDANAFRPSGDWNSAPMPYQIPDLLTEDQVNDVIAYLLTQ